MTISEVASENAKILAFKLKKLAIARSVTQARSHKQSRKLTHPRGVTRVGMVTIRRAIGLIKPAVSLIRPPVGAVSPIIRVVKPAIREVKPTVSLISPAIRVVKPTVNYLGQQSA